MRFLGLLLLSFSLTSLAAQLETTIHDIDFGQKTDEDILVLLSSGQVAKLPKWDKGMIDQLQLAKAKNELFKISLDQKRNITSLISLPSKKIDQVIPSTSNLKSMLEYIPTTVESMSKAKQYFREQRLPQKEETQCFNRAMVWTYEWWKAHSLKSNKILVFFTRNYIRRYDFEWWFHIAPYLHVMDNGKVVERVMDRKYSGGPIDFRRWTNIFVHGDIECPVITKYSEYAENPYIGDCYIYRTHMYTYQPADLQMYEAWGYTKDLFNMNEVKGAYDEAFSAPEPREEEETETEGSETETTTLTSL